jgi:malate dehydrogenase (oxaloacetate-decarboxylating)(NADP+)
VAPQPGGCGFGCTFRASQSTRGDKKWPTLSAAEQALRDAALEYHRAPTRGKIAVTPTKPLSNQRDLSLAYSPGVAYACLAIEQDPSLAAEYTSRGNLVGVVTNGTAVLGLGDIGPLAGKPVMEGKGCLFKKFAGIDVFDIELAERDPDKLVDIIAALEPTLGGVNLEDIKAPECFYIEKKLRERMNIPVFHDDQHGTAIISAAALLNGLELVGKDIGEVKVAVSGAGAAAIACLDVMVGPGREAREHLRRRQQGRGARRPRGLREARREQAALLPAHRGAHPRRRGAGRRCLPGLQRARRAVGRDGHQRWPTKPIILALANPEPEIRPELAKAARPDCIIATGRSDYPNQVNNVLCFPYIFRGALDCGATKITEAMKLACVREIAALAKAETSDEVAAAYAGQELKFGPDYLIPKPFDARLILRIAPAVARAAAESGVATRPIADYDAYRETLTRFVYQTGMVMRPVFAAAKAQQARQAARVVYAEGEDERVLRAVQVVLDEGLAKPILVGRPEVVKMRIERAGLRLAPGATSSSSTPRTTRASANTGSLPQLMAREGVTPEVAKAAVRRSNTLISAMMLRRGEADAMVCGLVGRYDQHLDHMRSRHRRRPGVRTMAAMNALMLPEHTLFITDTFVNEEPSAEELADIAMMAAAEVRRFGVPPKVAFLSHSMFGSSSRDRRGACARRRPVQGARGPDIECDGEMHGDAALSDPIRRGFLPETTLSGSANLLVLPNLDAANILFNVLKMTGGHGVTIGPVLLGAAKPAHILTPSATVRRIVNMTAVAVAAGKDGEGLRAP